MIEPVTPQRDPFVLAPLGIPRVDAERWRLGIAGLVERVASLTASSLSIRTILGEIRSGVMFAAGPMTNSGGTSLAGSSSSGAEDFAEVKAIAACDPFHMTGLRSYTLRRWSANEGSDGAHVID